MADTRWLEEYELTSRECDLAAFVTALEPSLREWPVTYPAREFNPGGYPISRPEDLEYDPRGPATA